MSKGDRRSQAAIRRAEAALKKADATRKAAGDFADKHESRIERDLADAERGFHRAAAEADAKSDAIMGMMDDALGGDVSDEEVDKELANLGVSTTGYNLPDVPTHTPTPAGKKTFTRTDELPDFPEVPTQDPSKPTRKPSTPTPTAEDLLAEAEVAAGEPLDLEGTSPREIATSARDELSSIARDTERSADTALTEAADMSDKLTEEISPKSEEKKPTIFQQFASWVSKKATQAYNAVAGMFGGGDKKEDKAIDSIEAMTGAASDLIRQSEQERQRGKEAARATEKEARAAKRAAELSARKATRVAAREARANKRAELSAARKAARDIRTIQAESSKRRKDRKTALAKRLAAKKSPPGISPPPSTPSATSRGRGKDSGRDI